MCSCSPLHSVPKFGHRNGRHFEMLIRTPSHPAAKVKRPFFAPDDNVGIQNYCHLSDGDFRVLRAARKSRCHAAASAAVNLVWASTSARSRPVQTFSPSGANRATGEPFLTNIKVTF